MVTKNSLFHKVPTISVSQISRKKRNAEPIQNCPSCDPPCPYSLVLTLIPRCTQPPVPFRPRYVLGTFWKLFFPINLWSVFSSHREFISLNKRLNLWSHFALSPYRSRAHSFLALPCWATRLGWCVRRLRAVVLTRGPGFTPWSLRASGWSLHTAWPLLICPGCVLRDEVSEGVVGGKSWKSFRDTLDTTVFVGFVTCSRMRHTDKPERWRSTVARLLPSLAFIFLFFHLAALGLHK